MAPPIPILIDDRERASLVPDALARTGAFAIEMKRLALGDYLVDERFLFERKTLPDLALSIQDGRLFGQALRLAASPLRAGLILEGTVADLEGSGMRWEAMQGALITVACSSGCRCCAVARRRRRRALSSSSRARDARWPAARFPGADSGPGARRPCSGICCKACPASDQHGRPACSNASARWKRY